MREMLGEMVESCAPSGCRACSVCFLCTCQMFGRIVLSSTLVLTFHIALVFLRVSAVLLQGSYSHTEKHMRGQRMRQKIARRASSVFASSSRQGAVVERVCATACIQAKFGCSESTNEQSRRDQGGSESGRRGVRRVMTGDQVHATTVVGECTNSGQRGRFTYTCGPHGVPQEYARCGGTEQKFVRWFLHFIFFRYRIMYWSGPLPKG